VTFRRISAVGACVSPIHSLACQWRVEKNFKILFAEPDFEWLMTDASLCKVRSHATGAKGGNQAIRRIKGGST